MAQTIRNPMAAFLLAAGLAACSHGPARTLQTMRIDFHIDRISNRRGASRLSGGSLDPNARNRPGSPVTFTDRPTTCKRNPDGVSFDCLRYKDMHIDNGFLCGTYILYDQVFRPCFAPVRASGAG